MPARYVGFDCICNVYTLCWQFINGCKGESPVSKKPEKKEKKKSGKKDSQLILRLDKEARDEFISLCKELDTSAAREIRGFIREFVKKHGR